MERNVTKQNLKFDVSKSESNTQRRRFERFDQITQSYLASFYRGNRNRDGQRLRRSRIWDRIRVYRNRGSCGNHP